MTGWNAYETMSNELSADTLLDALARALSDDELLDCMQWIARCHAIDLDEDEE